MTNQISIGKIVAGLCFTSIALLPWWILIFSEPGWIELGAFIHWLVVGSLAWGYSQGITRGEK